MTALEDRHKRRLNIVFVLTLLMWGTTIIGFLCVKLHVGGF